MSDPEKIRELIKQEYGACARNPAHFAKKYCYISHPKKSKILFNLYPFQEKTLLAFLHHDYTIINKSRQLGISTLVAMYSLWLMLFNRDKLILVVATKQDTAKNMVTKVKYMYDNLPKWLRGMNPPLEDNKLSLKLANNSQIIASSAASDAGRSYAASLLIIDEAAFIEDIDRIYRSTQPTLATGGGCIALSSPNGVGNWFYIKWTKAVTGERSLDPSDEIFFPIELPWDVHPERDAAWFKRESSKMSIKEIAQEYCCDFLASGNTVVDPIIIKFYETEWVIPPIEKRLLGGDLWVWKTFDISKTYMVCADVGRGDGNDFSAFHVIEVESCEQVAEFKSHIGTREYAQILIAVASEYNNALIIVDNTTIGWDTINEIISRGYPNLYYSPKSYGEMNLDKYMEKLDSDQIIPGLTISTKTRPLIVAKLESYIRDKAFVFHSKRMLEELRVFIWHNGKAQAQNGCNDDLVMAAGMGMFLRDTSLKMYNQSQDLTRASLNGINRVNAPSNIISQPRDFINPWHMPLGNGQFEDITWLL